MHPCSSLTVTCRIPAHVTELSQDGHHKNFSSFLATPGAFPRLWSSALVSTVLQAGALGSERRCLHRDRDTGRKVAQNMAEMNNADTAKPTLEVKCFRTVVARIRTKGTFGFSNSLQVQPSKIKCCFCNSSSLLSTHALMDLNYSPPPPPQQEKHFPSSSTYETCTEFGSEALKLAGNNTEAAGQGKNHSTHLQEVCFMCCGFKTISVSHTTLL